MSKSTRQPPQRPAVRRPDRARVLAEVPRDAPTMERRAALARVEGAILTLTDVAWILAEATVPAEQATRALALERRISAALSGVREPGTIARMTMVENILCAAKVAKERAADPVWKRFLARRVHAPERADAATVAHAAWEQGTMFASRWPTFGERAGLGRAFLAAVQAARGKGALRKWDAIAEALRVAGLAPASSGSLGREWRRWQTRRKRKVPGSGLSKSA